MTLHPSRESHRPGRLLSKHPPHGGVSMRKLIVVSLTALASAPVIGLAALQATAPVFADTPGVSPTCFPQSANPHPTAPAGQTTDTFFCTATNPNGSGSDGSGSGGSGSAGSGSSGSGSTNAANG